jgi:excisionase family DNA binding protein
MTPTDHRHAGSVVPGPANLLARGGSGSGVPGGPKPDASPWLTVREAAEYASLSVDTIYSACERRELKHVKVGGRRSIRVRPDWIDAWLEAHTYGGIVGG